MAKTVKKAQIGASTPRMSLRQGQYKRLGRLLSKKGTDKAQEVAERMVERRSRKTRGQEFLKKNISKLYPEVPEIKRKGGKVVAKAKKGGSFPDLNKDGKITKADILKGRGVIAKGGSKVKKAQDGFRATNKQRTKGSDPLTEYYPKIKRGSGNLIPVGATKHPKTGKALRAPKKMMGGGKCRYGC